MLRGWHASKAANGELLKRAQTEAKQQSQMLNHNSKNTYTCNNNNNYNTPLYKSIKTLSQPFKEFTKRHFGFYKSLAKMSKKYIQTQTHSSGV